MSILTTLRLAAMGAAALISSAALAGPSDYDYQRRGGYHGGGSRLIGGCAGTLGGCRRNDYIPGGNSIYGPAGGARYRHGSRYAYQGGGYAYQGGGYADGDSQVERGYYAGGSSNLPVQLGYTGAEYVPGGGYDYGGYAYGGGCGATVVGCGGYAYGGCGGGCGGSVAYPTYPLPTTSSVIYNRPSLFPGWLARAGYGYYGTGADCFCR